MSISDCWVSDHVGFWRGPIMRGPSERNVERCCPVGLRYLSCCIAPKKVTIKRDLPLIAVTSEPTATTHTSKRRRMRFVHVQYRELQSSPGTSDKVRYAAMSPGSPTTGINCRPYRTTPSG